MITNTQTKVISLLVMASLILTATFLWPTRALADGPICSGPLTLTILDDSPAENEPGTPATSTLIITNPALINDLNVIISTTHTYVGDLVFTLTHKIDPTITSTAIISRPLRGTSAITGEVACSGDDIFVTLDDEAAADIQVNCTEGTTGNDGTKAYSPDGQAYKPYSPLSVFDTDTLSGTWELTIADYYSGDEGLLEGWCLVPTLPPNLQISKDDGGITVTPGDPITYTLTYTNSGGAATGVVITETVPDNTSFNAAASSPSWQPVGATSQYTYSVDTLASGVSGVITFAVSVSNSLPSGVNTITNTAQIGDNGVNGTDEDLGDNTSIQVTPVDATPDLTITKVDGGITATAGSLITYTLTYTNKSGQDATGVVITETVPVNTSFSSSPGWQQVGATNQYTYNVVSLSVGPSQAITFVVAVDNPLPGGVSTITNTVQIGDNGANGADQDLSDNQDEETTPTAITSQKIYLPLILRDN